MHASVLRSLTPLAALGLSLFCRVSASAPDGIYSAPAITVPFSSFAATAKAFAPTPAAYRNLTPWAPGELRYELKSGSNGSETFAEARTNKHAVVGTLKFPTLVPVADAFAEFEYRVPDGIAAKEIHLNLRIQGATKQSNMRLPVVTGKWVREKISFANVIGGDRWRLNGDGRRLTRTDTGDGPLATSIEVGLIVDKGGEAVLQFRKFDVIRQPSCWGPLALPRRIDIPTSGVTRTLPSSGTITNAWLQIIADSPVEVIVNGHSLGTAALRNVDTKKWPSTSIPVAREFVLDTHLRTNQPNTLLIRPVDNAGATSVPVLCALGYTTTDTEGNAIRHVLVSDSNWSIASDTPARITDRPYKGNEPARWGAIVDIYPLRNPQAWTTSATFPHDATPFSTAQLADVRATANSLHLPADAFPRTGPATPWRTAAPASPGNPSPRWKLITPQSIPYHFLGTQVIGLFPRENYHYYRSMSDRYPSEDDYLADTLAQIKKLGFNGIAPAITTETAFRSGHDFGLTYFEFLGPASGVPIRDFEGRTYRMPDPFNAAWRDAQRTRVRDRVRSRGWLSDPAMIGVFVDNELNVDGAVNGGSLVGYFYSPDCRAAFVQWLAKRYGNSIEKLRDAWSPELPAAATLASFDAAPDINPASVQRDSAPKIVREEEGHASPRSAAKTRGTVRGDLYDFAVFTAATYASFVLEVFRAELPGKLIASNRFMGNATDEMLAAWKDYDLIAWNVYPFARWQAGIYTNSQLEDIRHAHRVTGKPIVLSETGIQALDTRLPNPSAQLYTQKQRGEEYAKLLRQVHDELPAVVGFVLFCWQNLSDTEGQSWGIVDDDGRPYSDYAQHIMQANHELMKTLP
ncbi:beta-galactosidase [Opitutaceae bacterium TAV1]|nr:beta-galactosidase [Opitutaceae bacterium TAV1]